jgi:sugar phosphate isomerase/epimerase
MPRFGLATLNHSPLHGLPTQWERHVEAAAAAGFDALAPDVFWLRALEGEGVALEDLARALDASGLACMELAGIAIGEPESTARELDEACRQAEILNAEFVNARLTVAADEAAMEQLRRCAEALGRVGARVALEFSRGTGTQGIADCLAFVESAEAAGAGVTLDTWHFCLASNGPDWDALEALPLESLANVQLSDGIDYGDGTFWEATMNELVHPGEGELPLGRVADLLQDKGFDGAVIVEVLSAPGRARALDEFAREAARAAHAWWWGESRANPSPRSIP